MHHALTGLVLCVVGARPAGGLSLRELESAVPGQLLEEEIPPTNQAVHRRPDQIARYRTLTDSHEEERQEHSEAFGRVGKLLGRIENMSHSRQIWEFVMSHPFAPILPSGGCLYLPNNKAWTSFYGHLEHPYPPLFLEMVANSYYPDCNATALTGMWLPSSCGVGRMWGSKGCFAVSSHGRAAGIEIFETDGHIGLPEKWSRHIHRASWKGHRVRRKANATSDGLCGASGELREVPNHHRLAIPTVYVICRASDDDWRITREMVEEQNKWANQAYKGESPWNSKAWDAGRPEAVDMQIQFDLVDVQFVTDPDCARYGFGMPTNMFKYNKKPLEYFTFVIIVEDLSGVLGQTEFPQDFPENSAELMVAVSSMGFRHFSSKTNSGDEAYDEGDTVVHESGHALGLFHTFENGCGDKSAKSGDWVEDTNPENLPHYACESSRSCGKSDPVHNFMDYSPDSCMVGFTQGQKKRAWCMLQTYRNTLFKASLREH